MGLAAGGRLGPYEIVAPLGSGGMGEVYRAWDPRLRRAVAVKVLPQRQALDGDRRARFEREARATGALNHPNIVAVYDVGETAGLHYVVSELLEGRTLRAEIRAGIPTRKAIDYAKQIAHGLAAAHARGVVHRDLKPENVFVSRDGPVKILDFGLAKLVQDQDEETATKEAPEAANTDAGTRLGTVAYMSPEQARAAKVDQRSDIFSLGVVLYEMLTGVQPFRRPTSAETLGAILWDDPPPLSASHGIIPPALEKIVLHCLEKHPEARFRSAQDLAFALETFTPPVEAPSDRRGAPGAVPAPPPPGLVRRVVRGVWPRRVAVGLLLATCTAAAWMAGKRLRPAAPAWTPRQLTADPGWEAEPALSPDGSTIAFASGRAGNPDIWLLDVRGGSPVRLTDDPASDRSPAWFPDGSALAFVSDRGGKDAIWKTPRFGGSAVLLLPGAVDPAVSPDGTRLAFTRPAASGQWRIGVAELRDLPRARLLTGPKNGLWDHRRPAWSPDGRMLCYSDFRDLWLVPSSGGRPRLLTLDHATDERPAWSSDGRSLYFSSEREGTTALWRVSADGGHPVRLTLGTGPEGQPSVARDGSRMAYSTYASNQDVVLLDLRSRARSVLPSLWTETMPVLAPDRSAVVFASERSGDFELWSQPLTPGGQPLGAARRLTELPGSEAVLAFSPDGRWIAFARVFNEQRSIWVMPSSGGSAGPFTRGGAVDIHPAWAPDGSRLAFVSNRGGQDHVWVGAIKEGGPAGPPRQLTSGEASDAFPAWSPGGASIAFIRYAEDGVDVWAVASEGNPTPRRLTKGSGVRSLRWNYADGSLWVSGTWEGSTVALRRLDPSTGESAALDPPLFFGRPDEADVVGDFDLSRDGRLLVFSQEETRGDIWLLEGTRGSF